MRVTTEKLTGLKLARRACQFTLHSQQATTIALSKIYQAEHSPMRTQEFWIEMFDIPSFVSVHMVRHNIGVTHYVQTSRVDRGAKEVADRNTLVNHAMLINAQALVNMGRKRLCKKASDPTQKLMLLIREEIFKEDQALANVMKPECFYRGYQCHEIEPCGLCPVAP